MDKELVKKLLSAFHVDCSLENYEAVEVDGVEYYAYLVEELQTEDEGKYQNGGGVYAIGIFNGEYEEIKEPLLYIEQDFTRSGSYFSDWYYEYHEPYVVAEKVVTITEWCAV